MTFNQTVEKHPCSVAVQKRVTNKYLRRQWTSRLVSTPGTSLSKSFWHSDTQTKTQHELWLEKDSVNYSLLNSKEKRHQVYKWTVKDRCVEKLTVEKQPEKPLTNQIGLFTDDDLFDLLKEYKWGVIYVWSPLMPLSIKGLPELEKSLRKYGGHLTVVLDPNPKLDVSRNQLRKSGISSDQARRVASAELLNRQITLHYPVAILYENGYLSNRTYMGYKSAEALESWIDRERKWIKAEFK